MKEKNITKNRLVYFMSASRKKRLSK